jgi:hypothetical protein
MDSLLTFYLMLPILLIIVAIRGNLIDLLKEIRSNLWQWLLWSTIGFGLFYATLTYGANYGPSWLVASTFEFTIIAGMFIGPLLEKRSAKSISKASLSSPFLFF